MVILLLTSPKTGEQHGAGRGYPSNPRFPGRLPNLREHSRFSGLAARLTRGADRYQQRAGSAECIGAVKHRVEGNPDPKHVSTSFAERQNLTLRMSSRRFTRLTNAFSKKVENHALSVALYYMNYNFCCIHKMLRITPAMAAGVTDRLWLISDMVQVQEDWENTT
jgi:hypothetical protein